MTHEPGDRTLRTQAESRYCGPCGEYYHDGDVYDSDTLESQELLALAGTECPFCHETGRTVDDLAEAEQEARTADFHDGGSKFWADIERNHGR